jgi:hypothetical protein
MLCRGLGSVNEFGWRFGRLGGIHDERRRTQAGLRSKQNREAGLVVTPWLGRALARGGKDKSGVSRDTTPTGNAGQPDGGGGNGIVSGCNEVFSSKVWVDHRIVSGCVRVGCRHLARAVALGWYLVVL